MTYKRPMTLYLSVAILALAICGCNGKNAEKLIPVSVISEFESGNGRYQLAEEFEFQLSEERPELYYSGEGDSGHVILSFSEMKSSAITYEVTIFDKNGKQTYSGGFDHDAAVKITLESGDRYQIKYVRGVKDNQAGAEEKVDSASGKIRVYC